MMFGLNKKILQSALQKSSNPFQDLTPEEKHSLHEVEEDVKKDIELLTTQSKDLFNDQRYKKLKAEFDKIYETSIKTLVEFDCDDADKYVMKMRGLQIQIRTLRAMFTVPEGFIKKEIDNAYKD